MTEEDVRKQALAPEELNDMPFSAHLMTADELRIWKEGRIEAGAHIDFQKCEVEYWQIDYFDPYGLAGYLGDSQEYRECAWEWFVRSPGTGGWINYHDVTV
jgi:hypothetical protein